MKHHSFSFLYLILVAIIAGGVGFFGAIYTQEQPFPNGDESIRQSGYTFINPLLECENNDSFAKQKYIPFEKDTIKRIKDEVEKIHPGTEIAIYFRNLNNGPWFGINENAQFLPASLMKVTLLISYLKWWEDDSSLLEKKLRVTSEVGLNQLIPPDKKLETGKEYTIGELLEYMIIYSDNTASKTLFEHIPSERQSRTFIDLGVPVPDIDPNYTLSVKEYASFFRVLYNASYLSKKSSETGLAILSKSAFRDGIVSGIGGDLTVAHKFGEREIAGGDGHVVNQLHDCGIVYDKSYPYLLCVMTRAKDKSIHDLSAIVGEISSIIFSEVNKRYPLP